MSSSASKERRGALSLSYFDGHAAVRLLRHAEGAHLVEYAPGDDLVTLVQRGQDEDATRVIAQVIGHLHGVPQDAPQDGLLPLERWFESAPIKACFGFDAVVGNFASPWTPGSAYVLLHHVFGEVNGKKGTWGHAIGGMGAITQAMRLEAEARGVRIRTGQGVARALVRDGKARGVVLDVSRAESSKAGSYGALAVGLLFFGVVSLVLFRMMTGRVPTLERARTIDPQQVTVTFADVAGVDEAKDEVREIVDFLKEAARFD